MEELKSYTIKFKKNSEIIVLAGKEYDFHYLFKCDKNIILKNAKEKHLIRFLESFNSDTLKPLEVTIYHYKEHKFPIACNILYAIKYKDLDNGYSYARGETYIMNGLCRESISSELETIVLHPLDNHGSIIWNSKVYNLDKIYEF